MKCTFCGGFHSKRKYFKYIIKDRDKSCASGDMYRQQTEFPTCKCSRCGSIDHIIVKCPQSPKDNYKWWNNVGFNESGDCASEK